jgi:Ca-activated chloride channel homolog
MIPAEVMRALPWLCIAAGLLAFALLLRAGFRSVALHKRSVLLIGAILGVLPALYVAIVWTGLLTDRYLRVARPWGALVCAASVFFVAWRLATLSARFQTTRKMAVEALGVAATLLAGLAIAGLDLGKPLDRLTIIVVIDRSRSIDLVSNADERIRAELRLAEQSMRDDDRIGTVVFAANAATEDPPHPRSDLAAPQKLELGRDGTDLGGGIRRALAEVPADSAARIVVISDGVSNRGDPIAAAAAAVAAEVPVDTIPLDQRVVPDVRVVSLRMPGRANAGEILDMRLVTASSAPAEINLRIKRDGKLFKEGTARIEAGEDVLRLKEKAPGPGLHRYDVEITAKDPALDQAAEDNAGSTFVRVRGPATALVLEGSPGKGSFITKALLDAEFSATSGALGSVPGDLGALALYDVVFLSDIAASDLSPSQIEAFASYVRDLGGGLVLMGGDKSMGPGGYARTAIEEISPVSFDIKQERRRASLAEAIMIDYSGSMAASAGGKYIKLDLANEASARSATLLGPGDRLAVAHVDTAVTWTVPMSPVTDVEKIGKAIRAVKPGGGGIYTDLALRSGYAALEKETVNLKHLLLFADGSDAEQLPGCRALVSDAKRRGITTSVVALGKGSDVPELEVLSKLGDGRFYLIEDANRLPAVFTQETILAAKSSIHEIDFRVNMGSAGPPTRGIDFATAPILRGYVVTIPKTRSTILLSGPEGDPILATWSAGMGRSAAFTSDLKDRWGVQWTLWPGASSLVAQLARDLSRLADDPHVRLESDAIGGELHIRAEVIGDDGRAQSFRRLTAHVAGPDGFARDIPLEPIGAGSYAATLPLSRPGTFVVTARDELKNENVGTTGAVLTAGEELRPTGSDRALLTRVSSMTGGKTRDTMAGIFRDRMQQRFSYRPLSGWLAALSALALLFGVAARRISLPTGWMSRARGLLPSLRRKNREPTLAAPDALETVATLAKAKERGRAAEPPARQPAMFAAAPLQRATRAPVAADAPASLRSPTGPVSSGTRQLTAAEILLERRRGRKG